ncbi:hypothetical protein ONS95_012425 [Cadophora gregata]|uniref:uncharacterized protein n=1 Tax=Cadophora gregata TaxID=51156 RepID=UPI0026DCA016|nr:uncharacterized protein ONS95_012425 [Cadophora gregata]KAK0118120.1 hypothetical protein ONS95_012425 [Cadophora gregata]KAK0123190.1 hypothetical protein ONS96_010190 [Cadophora gregata f. sp. sojae]
MAACPVGNHGNGRMLISDLMFASGQAGSTVYDALMLPMYKSHEDHQRNHDLLAEELAAGTGCTCASRANALTAVTNAFNQINTPALKLIHDNQINATVPGVLPVPVQVGVFPSIVGEPLVNTEFPITHGLTNVFTGVEYYTRTEFVKMDRTQTLLPRNMEYSFWYALSMAMYDDEMFWAGLKETVCTHTFSIFTSPAEPRHDVYQALIAYAARTRFPFGRIGEQVEPDARLPGSPYTLEPPGPEIWQFVADALKIELLVIIAHIPATRNPRARHKTVVPRGEHNNKQILLLLEEDGEYRAVRPKVDHPTSWHFEKHMPPHYAGPMTRPQHLARPAVIERSNLRRCPLVEIDEWGIPKHLDKAAGTPEAIPQGIRQWAGPGLIPPGAPLPPRYVAPFEPLGRWQHDGNDTEATWDRIDEHLNPGCRRWI